MRRINNKNNEYWLDIEGFDEEDVSDRKLFVYGNEKIGVGYVNPVLGRLGV